MGGQAYPLEDKMGLTCRAVKVIYSNTLSEIYIFVVILNQVNESGRLFLDICDVNIWIGFLDNSRMIVGSNKKMELDDLAWSW